MFTFKRTKQFASLAVVLALSIIISRIESPTPALSQANSCSALVSQIIQDTRQVCRVTDRGNACYGNSVSATGATGFDKPGDILALANVQGLTSQAANPNGKTWGAALLRLRAGLPEDGESALTMLALGDAKIVNAVDPKAQIPTSIATNRNKGSLNIFAGPDTRRLVVGALLPLEKTPANGRTDKSDWIRIERNGKLGWVRSTDVALDKDVASLQVAQESDVTPLYREPMQAFTLQTSDAASCKDAPNGVLIQSPADGHARILVNGVQLETSGAAFLSASGGALTITGLQGRIDVTASGKTVTVRSGQVTTVPLDNQSPKGQPTDPANAEASNLPDLLNSFIYGQPYTAPGATSANFGVEAGSDKAAVNDPIRVNLSFTGDASVCPAPKAAALPLDVSLVIEASDATSGAYLEAARAAAIEFTRGLNLEKDQVGIVAFNSKAQTISPLGQRLNLDNVASLSTLQPGSPTSVPVGLAAGVSQIKQSKREGQAVRAVVLVAASNFDPEAMSNIVAEVKNNNARLIVVAVGNQIDHKALANAIGSENDILTAQNALDIRDALDKARLSLTQPVAARDVTLNYTVDSSRYQIVDEALAASGGTKSVEQNVVTARWSIPTVWDTQTVNFPLVVRPLKDGKGPIGTARLTYLTCGEGDKRVTMSPLDAPAVEVAASSAAQQKVLASPSAGALAVGDSGSGAIPAFGQEAWLLDLKGDQLFSVITEGTKKPLSAIVSDAAAEPLYTLENLDGKGRNLSVFSVSSGGPHWLYLSSQSAAAAGPYTVTINSGTTLEPTVGLTVDSDRIQDRQTDNEGHIYGLVGAKGDGSILTFRYTGEEPIDPNRMSLPIKVVSLDGHVADEVHTKFDKDNNQWVTVQTLRGSSSYYVVVKSADAYTLGVESEDTLTNDRGSIKVGETRKNQSREGANGTFRYKLDVPSEKTFSLVASGSASALRLLDAADKMVQPANVFNTNGFIVQLYNLKPGSYTAYLDSTGDFDVALAEGNVVSAIKGSLGLGQTLQEELAPGDNFAAYRLVTSSTSSLNDGDVVTINLTAQVPDLSSGSVFIESVNGLRSQVTQDFVDKRGTYPQLISVQELRGKGPYRVRITGARNYTIRIDSGDLLSNDKGQVIDGEEVRDSSRAPEVLYYSLAPELGRELGEGDVVTISFTPQAISDQDFKSVDVQLQNGDHELLPSLQSYTFKRQFVKVYQLVGQAPYRLGIPNIGAYVLDFNVGNKLLLDQGKVELGKTVQDRTDGPQLVQYAFDGQDKQLVTVKIKDTRGKRYQFNPKLINADGDAIPIRRVIELQNEGSSTLVYALRGAGPYTLTFEMDGIYELTVSRGDELTLFKGNFYIGDAETSKVEDRTRLVTYQLSVKAKQTISIQVTTFIFFLRNPNGDLVPPADGLYVTDNGRFGRLEVFNLKDPGNYELSFPAFGDYTIRVTEGDQLTASKGNFYVGNVESDKLDKNKSFATYTLDGQDGQIISLRAEIDDFKRLPNGNLNLTDVQIVSAKGDISDVKDEVTDAGYMLRLYQLRGPGPYTLTFSPQRGMNKYNQEYATYPQHEYRLTILNKDDLNVDKGKLAVDTPLKDSVPGGKRRVSYTFAGDQGSDVTMKIEQKQARQLVKGTLVDANGVRLAANAANLDKNTTSLASYTLTGPGPYRFSFEIADDYTITAAKGDLLRTNLGALEVGKPVSNKLAAPAIGAIYTIDGKEGDVISVQLQQANSTLVGQLKDAVGNVVPTDVQYLDKGSSLFIYRLPGAGTFQMSFTPGSNAPHTVTLAGPDVINAKLGDLAINPKSDDPKFKPTVVKNKLPAPARVAIYNIPAQEGDTLTLDLGQADQTKHLEPKVTNANGQAIGPQVTVIDRGEVFSVYKMQGAAPYTLVFETTSDYTVTLTQGDVLRADAGPMPIGKQDKPYQNTLKAPARIAVHSLDVAPGQVITIQLENSNRKIVEEVRDGAGNLLQPEVRDFQQGRTNVSVYILSGSAPYTLSFPVSGQYTATVYSGNLIRFDGGIAPFDKGISGTVAPPSSVTTYTVDGKRDQIVTVQVKGSGKPVKVDFRDANGKLWLPELQFNQGGTSYFVYLLSGPAPYTITFGAQRYDLTVSNGNVLRADLGSLPFDQKVTNNLKPPARTAIYTFDGQPGELISVWIKQSGSTLEPEVRDANQKILRREALVTRNNSTVGVYTLSGPAPYTVEFTPQNQYDIMLRKGNALRADQGVIAFGQAQKVTLPEPALTAIYGIDAKEGELVSVQLAVGSKPGKSTLLNAKGEAMKPQAQIEKNNATYSIFTLSGPAPYTLEFDAPNPYELTVTAGNVLRADKGVIRFGNTETDQLTDPQGVAIYTIDGHPGQTISLKIQDRGQPIESQLRSADGKQLQPWGEATANNATYTVFTLSGPAPYTVTFVPGGKYSITLTEGSIFNADQGVVTFGATVNNTLQTPARVAMYTVNTAPDQVISAELINKGQGGFIKAVLRDADGKVIEPKSTIYDGTNSVTTVYMLSGPGPYTFTFETTQAYTLTFTRGDASVTKLKVFATPTMTPTPAPDVSVPLTATPAAK